MKIPRIFQTMALATAAIALSFPVVFAQGSGGQTTLEIYNADNNPVVVYMTLSGFGANNPGFVQNCLTLPWRHPVNMVGQPLQGHFKLNNGDNASLTLPVGQAISGNLVFGGQPPDQCPTSQNPNGQNLAEFTLDNNTPAFSPAYTQEAVDISCVNGVNSKMTFAMAASGGSGPWSTTGFSNVTSIANVKFGKRPSSNINIPGVFPVGCDNCTSDDNPGCNPTWAGYTGSSTHLCNVQRPANRSGGTVRVTFSGLFPASALRTMLNDDNTITMYDDQSAIVLSEKAARLLNN